MDYIDETVNLSVSVKTLATIYALTAGLLKMWKFYPMFLEN
jgi:hypothetical protein